jgi:N-acetylmuramoyl-L-alanine amidase
MVTPARSAGALACGCVSLVLLAAAAPADAARSKGVSAHATMRPVSDTRTFLLPPGTSNIAIHWRGHRRAHVRVAFSRRKGAFGRRLRVRLDEVALQRRTRETYGTVMPVARARVARVWVDRPIRRLTVVTFRARSRARLRAVPPAGLLPAVIPRAGWGADESLRFDGSGNETWPPAFWPIQKLIVHHTDTANDDPDPAATVRSIYYYHAVTQRWGDIGYNFLIDESGRVYEGRHSRDYAPGETPTGQDTSGRGVTAAHAQGFNSATVGVALLGTLSNREATPAARDALERLLTWEAYGSGIDPQAASEYVNPVSGQHATFPNIAGHRDVGATECPGSRFYASLPAVRAGVSTRLAAASAYARPKAATPVRVSLVPAFAECLAPDRTHGGPLAFGACSQPRQASSNLTVGTPDANGQAAQSTGSLRLDAIAGDRSTPADEADIRVAGVVTDVRNKVDLSDYAGELAAKLTLRVTDGLSGASGTDPATVTDVPFRIAIQCAATSTSAGGTCSIATTADAILPGAVPEGRRSVWGLGQVEVLDGGPDGVASTSAGNTPFADQGVFIP